MCVRRYTQQGHGRIQSAEHVTSALVSSRLKVSGWEQTPKKISKTPPPFLHFGAGKETKRGFGLKMSEPVVDEGGEETAKIISSQRRATPLVGKSAEVGG